VDVISLVRAVCGCCEGLREDIGTERAARVRWLAFRWSERCVGAVGRVARVGCRCGVRRFRARCAAVSPGKFLFFASPFFFFFYIHLQHSAIAQCFFFLCSST